MLTRIHTPMGSACQEHPDTLHESYPNFNLSPSLPLRHTQVGLILCYLTSMRRQNYDGRAIIDSEIERVKTMRAAYGIHG